MTREEQIELESYRWFLKDFYETNGGENPDQEDVENAFQRGAEWADSHPAWVSVEERLPKRMREKSRFSETVLVYNKEGFNDTAYYDYEEKIWRWLPGVTHWMPLPTPPVEKGGEQ